MYWERASFSPIGSLFLSLFAPVTLSRLALLGMFPKKYQDLKEKFYNRFIPNPKTDFHSPYPPEEAARLLASTFKDIGTHKNFAPLVIVMGHSASSVNNPFSAAYNCGACGGREGGPNARLFARLANDPKVRAILSSTHNIFIPNDTHFIGGQHNTTSDIVEYFDLDFLPKTLLENWNRAEKAIQGATEKNALERCHRFLLASEVKNTKEGATEKSALERCHRFLLASEIKNTKEALEHVRTRAIDPAEIRPELNHATNAGVIIGRRELTNGSFLDRRCFLPSYDPKSDDERGTNLEHVLAPALNVCSGINLEYLFSTTHVEEHGAGTKVPLNVVGNIGVLQGTSGDLRPGLPSQMTEMHTPMRALYVVDAPVSRVQAVLDRRPDLKAMIVNDWVRFFVRDPSTGKFFKQISGSFVPVDSSEGEEDAHKIFHLRPLTDQTRVALKEDLIWWGNLFAMAASCLGPIYFFGSSALNPFGTLIALGGTALAVPMLFFSRRYMHGEYMFGRVLTLSMGLLLGFNLIATAPTLPHLIAAWSLFGFSSAFLIGSYNDRPTVRNNATFVFGAYRISDYALLLTAAFATLTLNPELATTLSPALGAVTLSPEVAGAVTLSQAPSSLAAVGLLLAALYKSSQFPLTSLFVKSMEGPTPTSALGYAGLSAHIGIVLLAGLMPLWYPLDWARASVISIGIFTAIYSTFTSKIRADRKGAVANMTAATLGLIYVILAMGYPGLALFLSLGHAAFRMTQIVRSPNIIADTQNLKSALGSSPWPIIVPDFLFHISWTLRRFKTDFNLIYFLHYLSRPLNRIEPYNLTRFQQWVVTLSVVILAGFPYTPISETFEHLTIHLLHSHPILATLLIFCHFTLSVVLFRLVLTQVLTSKRFSPKLFGGNNGAKTPIFPTNPNPNPTSNGGSSPLKMALQSPKR